MADIVKRLVVLGSTGSIGRQTLDIVRAFPERFKVIGLAAGSNIALLKEQVREFKPGFVYHQGEKEQPSGIYCRYISMEEMAALPEVDTVIIATSGGSGLSPTLAAIAAGKDIALSNKESLVSAGEIIMKEVRERSARILPIDSEHSAIWQCLEGETTPASRIILTASGGPFLNYSLDELAGVTAEQALKHPSWKMGKKVTIDSATLMNKGLEIIEAHWLFGIPFEKISVLVHPQSIVHSIVEFADGSSKAQLGCPDMRLPIQYALTYPERLPNPSLPKIDWSLVSHLDFQEPDMMAFPCLNLAVEAGKKGGTYPAVLCAADEVVVELFLDGKIGFMDIPSLIQSVLDEHQPTPHPTVEVITAADAWARNRVRRLVCGGGS
ncbi:MAG TPA: 1-deoxy-D-xylulose-5-phosphate reductoisomerase [Dehalococcoidia bacterium]|nr:1-deoxy-D-xylulose-5-phosphate reductoisomerase [Dehalococcoidia bacterium]